MYCCQSRGSWLNNVISWKKDFTGSDFIMEFACLSWTPNQSGNSTELFSDCKYRSAWLKIVFLHSVNSVSLNSQTTKIETTQRVALLFFPFSLLPLWPPVPFSGTPLVFTLPCYSSWNMLFHPSESHSLASQSSPAGPSLPLSEVQPSVVPSRLMRFI